MFTITGKAAVAVSRLFGIPATIDYRYDDGVITLEGRVGPNIEPFATPTLHGKEVLLMGVTENNKGVIKKVQYSFGVEAVDLKIKL